MILENIDIDIDIDMVILENIDIDIDIDKAILQNIDIDKISNRFKFGLSNRARYPLPYNVDIFSFIWTVSTSSQHFSDYLEILLLRDQNVKYGLY